MIDQNVAHDRLNLLNLELLHELESVELIDVTGEQNVRDVINEISLLDLDALKNESHYYVLALKRGALRKNELTVRVL